MANEQRKINVKIADREYAFSAPSPEQEERIRRAADVLNRRISGVLAQNPGTNMLKVLTIIALNEINSGLRLQAQLSGIQKEADGLRDQMDTYLDNIEGIAASTRG